MRPLLLDYQYTINRVVLYLRICKMIFRSIRLCYSSSALTLPLPLGVYRSVDSANRIWFTAVVVVTR